MPDDHADHHGDGQHDRHDDVTVGEWMSIGEAARRLGVTRAAIYGRIERRTLPTRPRGNRGVEVLLPASDRYGNDHSDVAGDAHRDHQGDDHHDVTLISRLEELLERAVRAEAERDAAKALAAVELAALGRQRDAELEAAQGRLEVEIAARNAVIEQMRDALAVERARGDRLEAALREATRSWLDKLIGMVRRH